MKIIKVTGFAKKVWKKEDGKVDMIKLKETAEILLAVVLAVAAFSAGNTAYSEITGANGSTVLGAVEGVLSGIKTSEVAQIVAKVGPKLAGA